MCWVEAVVTVKVFYALLFVVLAAMAAACRSPQGGWTRQFGSTAHDVAERAAVDKKGDVYVTGWTEGVLPGQTAAGGHFDAFLRKYDPSGRELWTRQFGSGGSDRASGVVIDGRGDAYVSGSTSGVLDGQQTYGDDDVFVLKFDPSGKTMWVRQFGSDALEKASAMAVDSRDNVYLVGLTLGAVVGQMSDEDGDIFVRKYDPSGRELWTRQFGSETHDEVFALSVDGRGHLYLVGSTRLALPGQTAQQAIDAVLFKLDSDGHELWTRQFGSSEADQARSVAVDRKGIVHVAGWTAGAFPGQRSSTMTDAFINTFDSDGIELSSIQFGPVSYTAASCIAIDADGNANLSSTGLDPLTESAVLGGIVKIGDSAGSLSAFSQASCLSLDRGGNVYVVGWVLGALPGQANAGGGDAFVVKSAP